MYFLDKTWGVATSHLILESKAKVLRDGCRMWLPGPQGLGKAIPRSWDPVGSDASFGFSSKRAESEGRTTATDTHLHCWSSGDQTPFQTTRTLTFPSIYMPFREVAKRGRYSWKEETFGKTNYPNASDWQDWAFIGILQSIRVQEREKLRYRK